MTVVCGLAGGALGWVVPSLARWLVLRWGLCDQPSADAAGGDDVDSEVVRRSAAGAASPERPASRRLADWPSPLWHRAGLAAVTGAAGAGAATALGLGPRLALDAVFLAWLSLIAAIDLQTRLIPNRLTYPALLVAPAYALLWSGASPLGHVLGALVGASFFGFAFLINPRGIGLGDVKLAFVLGAYLGWSGTVVALAAAVALGGAVAALALLTGHSRKAAIPYGPMLATGGAVGLLAGEPLWRAYLAYAGLA